MHAFESLKTNQTEPTTPQEKDERKQSEFYRLKVGAVY